MATVAPAPTTGATLEALLADCAKYVASLWDETSDASPGVSGGAGSGAGAGSTASAAAHHVSTSAFLAKHQLTSLFSVLASSTLTIDQVPPQSCEAH